jgi:hypothetical protein
MATALLLGAHTAFSQKPLTKETAGYGDLDSMAIGFVRCLKSSPEALRAFCKRINLDSETVAFMQKAYNYTPSIIKDIKKMGLDIDTITGNYYRFMLDFRETLQRRGTLDSLSYTGREAHGAQQSPIYFKGFFLLRSGKSTYKCDFGEMIRSNGRWTTMAEPKFVMF